MKMDSPPLFFFPSRPRSLYTFLPVHNSPQVFPSDQVIAINHDLHLHLSGFTPLCKILTENHYLRSPHFQQQFQSSHRVIIYDRPATLFNYRTAAQTRPTQSPLPLSSQPKASDY